MHIRTYLFIKIIYVHCKEAITASGTPLFVSKKAFLQKRMKTFTCLDPFMDIQMYLFIKRIISIVKNKLVLVAHHFLLSEMHFNKTE